MLAKSHRIKNRGDIQKLFREGRRRPFTHFTAIVRRRRDADPSRFAITIGTRYAKAAYLRNRIKRQARGMLAPLLKRARAGFDVFIMIKSRAPFTPAARLSVVRELNELMQALEAIR